MEEKPTISELEDAIDKGQDVSLNPDGKVTKKEQIAADILNESFGSTDDQRVTNNILRHNYRTLSPPEKDQMQMVKDAGLDFITLLHEIGGTDAPPITEHTRQASRDLSLAQTHMEDAVMRAVKHITG